MLRQHAHATRFSLNRGRLRMRAWGSGLVAMWLRAVGPKWRGVAIVFRPGSVRQLTASMAGHYACARCGISRMPCVRGLQEERCFDAPHVLLHLHLGILRDEHVRRDGMDVVQRHSLLPNHRHRHVRPRCSRRAGARAERMEELLVSFLPLFSARSQGVSRGLAFSVQVWQVWPWRGVGARARVPPVQCCDAIAMPASAASLQAIISKASSQVA